MKKYFKLSHPQQRILMTDILFKDSPISNIGGYVCFHGDVDIDKLCDSITKTIDAMNSMRIRISFQNDEYCQYIHEKTGEIEVVSLDTEDENVVEQLAKEMLETPFVLLNHQLFNIKVFYCGFKFSGYILCMHHIIMDGWSVQLFANSVSNYYNGQDVNLGDYCKFIEKEQEYLNSERAQKDSIYWREFLLKNSNMSTVYERNCSGFREEFLLEGEVRNRYECLSDSYGGNVVLASCFLLLDYYRNKTCIIDLPNFNRTNRAFRNTGGMFTSTVLTAVEYDEKLTLNNFVTSVKREMMNGVRHQMWPYD